MTLEGTLSLGGDAVLLQGKDKERFSLKGKAEALWPARVQGTGHQGTATVKVALLPHQAIHVGGAEEFDLPLKPAAMEQVFAGSLPQGDAGKCASPTPP
ncbi:hypothetical protein, partial [Methylogaea oryzae]|uniref:hypothetical protein n=1 Tax=Methylogaea oryzae TaxID=1295382 RepID=UPI0020D012A9